MSDSSRTCTTGAPQTDLQLDPQPLASLATPAPETPAEPASSAAEDTPAAPVRRSQPRWNYRRTEQGATIEVALPGVSRDRLELTARHGAIAVTGRRPSAADLRQHFGELPPTEYHLELRLDRVFDATLTAARYENGLLTLDVPLAESARPRRIELS